MSRPSVAPGPHIRDLGPIEWMADAACARVPDLPWTDGATRHEAAQMREVCAACPVRTGCEEFATTADVSAGWWAGRSYELINGHGRPRRRDAA